MDVFAAAEPDGIPPKGTYRSNDAPKLAKFPAYLE
jgi:hypothetical protein